VFTRPEGFAVIVGCRRGKMGVKTTVMCLFVVGHVGNTTQKAVGRGAANVGPTCPLPTCWQHVGNMLALVAGTYAMHPSLG
jgi:hypothetical protein